MNTYSCCELCQLIAECFDWLSLKQRQGSQLQSVVCHAHALQGTLLLEIHLNANNVGVDVFAEDHFRAFHSVVPVHQVAHLSSNSVRARVALASAVTFCASRAGFTFLAAWVYTSRGLCSAYAVASVYRAAVRSRCVHLHLHIGNLAHRCSC